MSAKWTLRTNLIALFGTQSDCWPFRYFKRKAMEERQRIAEREEESGVEAGFVDENRSGVGGRDPRQFDGHLFVIVEVSCRSIRGRLGR